MRNILSLKIETRVSIAIIFIVVVIFLITIFKSLDNFYKFNEEINQYEKIFIKKNP
jgi:uncharacterized protein YoxC